MYVCMYVCVRCVLCVAVILYFMFALSKYYVVGLDVQPDTVSYNTLLKRVESLAQVERVLADMDKDR